MFISKTAVTRIIGTAMVAVVCLAGTGCAGNSVSSGNGNLNIGAETKIQEGATAHNAQYGLTLKVKSVDDGRCPTNVDCAWAGNAAVEFQLTTAKGKHDFTLDTHLPYPANPNMNFKNDAVIEGIKYALVDVSPYPVAGEKPPKKTVTVLVEGNP